MMDLILGFKCLIDARNGSNASNIASKSKDGGILIYYPG